MAWGLERQLPDIAGRWMEVLGGLHGSQGERSGRSVVVNSRQRSSIVTNGRQQIDSPRQQRRLSKIDSQLPASEENGGGA